MRIVVRFIIVALAILAAPLWGVEPSLLPHNSPFAGELFGFDTARCDGLTFEGRPYDASAGSVAVFRNTNLTDELFYPGAQINARFGHALDVTPDCRRLVVCAPDDDTDGTNAGQCFVFDRVPGTDTYTYTASLSGADSAANDELGQSAAISPDGNNIAAGAIRYANYTGKVYVWWQDGPAWGEKKLAFSDLGANDQGGYSLSFVGNWWLFVTAPFDYDVGSLNWEGSFYLFDRNVGGTNNWGQRWKNHITGAYKLGQDVSASGRRVALGAPGDAGFGDDASGDVYVIIIAANGGSWALEQHLSAPSPQTDAEFGGSVSLRANQLVVGEPWRDIGGVSNRGTWYTYLKPSEAAWSFLAEIRPANSGGTNARDGWSSDIFGGWFAGGAPFSDVDGVDAGAGYIYIFSSIFADGFELGDSKQWSLATP